MVAASGTTRGRIADAILPPALSLRLRSLVRGRDPYGHHGPPPLISGLVRPGSVGIDVGAHRGLWTYRISHRASAVHAFEPNPQLYPYLARTRIRGVTTHDVALSDTEGTAVLSMPDDLGSGRATIASATGTEIAPVQTRRLDSYELTDVGFMKIDVEGHEEAVLKGALDTLDRCRPNLVVEIEERHNPGALSRIPLRLAELGYAHAYFLCRGALVPLDRFDLQTHQLNVESPISPDYVNNFVFATQPIL